MAGILGGLGGIGGGSFDARIGSIESSLKGSSSAVRDWTSKIQSAAAAATSLSGATSRISEKAGSYRSQLEKLVAEAEKVGSVTKKQADAMAQLESQLEGVNKQLRNVNLLNKFNVGFDGLAKAALSAGTGLASLALDGLFSGIKRVYDLQLRWTKAVGEFNMRIGGASKNIGNALKQSQKWESAIRGLTDGALGEGMLMATEYAQAFGFVNEKLNEHMRLGVQLARGFNIGNKAAGELTRTFYNLGASEGEGAVVMHEMMKAGDSAGVVINDLAADLAGATDYVTRFGKEGMRTFVKGAAYVKQFGVNAKELQGIVEKFDKFDDAAESIAKLNATFGTAINSMDMMLQDDPAARFETIRRALLAQGKTYDTMSPKMVRALGSMTGMTEKQLSSMLDIKNAGVTYSDFLKKQKDEEETEAKAKAAMQKQLQSTVQTMYNFGIAFDRITMAIAKAIRPFLEVLGLVKKGDKEWKSFGGVMESITKTIIKFFENLAGNKKWMGFMEKLAYDARDAAKALGKFVSGGGIQKFISAVVPAFEKAYDIVKGVFGWIVSHKDTIGKALGFIADNIGKIAIGLIALRGVSAGIGVVSNVKNLLGGAGGDGDLLGRSASARGGAGTSVAGKKGRGGFSSSRLGRGMGLAGAGAAVLGSVMAADEGEGMSTAVGGAIGTAIGAALPIPFGSVIGGAIGSQLGPVVSKFLGNGPSFDVSSGSVNKMLNSAADQKVAVARSKIEKVRLSQEKQLVSFERQSQLSRDIKMRELDLAKKKEIEAAHGIKNKINEVNAKFTKLTTELDKQYDAQSRQRAQLEKAIADKTHQRELDLQLAQNDSKQIELESKRSLALEESKILEERINATKGDATTDAQEAEREASKKKIQAIDAEIRETKTKNATLLLKQAAMLDKEYEMKINAEKRFRLVQMYEGKAEFQEAMKGPGTAIEKEQKFFANLAKTTNDEGVRDMAVAAQMALSYDAKSLGITPEALGPGTNGPKPATKSGGKGGGGRSQKTITVVIPLDGKVVGQSQIRYNEP